MDNKSRSAVLEHEELKFDTDINSDTEDNAQTNNQSAFYPAAPVKVQKDIWDKIAALAPIISGLLIFVTGGYFTYSYNQQQLRLQEIQTIEKFIPHLMGNEQSKRAAIMCINSLTNADMAGKFAQIFASKGTVSALQSIAETGSESDRSAASASLAKALENIAARESKLNEMESAFQQALNEKNTQSAPVEDSTSQVEEADRLEHLADMCRTRGQLPVAESLLKQAVNIRIRVQLPGGAAAVIANLRKLSDVEAASGKKDESENTLKKVALIETKLGLSPAVSGTAGSASPPPPPPPTHDAVPSKGSPRADKGEGNESAKDKEPSNSAQADDPKGDKGDKNDKGEKDQKGETAFGELKAAEANSAQEGDSKN